MYLSNQGLESGYPWPHQLYTSSWSMMATKQPQTLLPHITTPLVGWLTKQFLLSKHLVGLRDLLGINTIVGFSVRLLDVLRPLSQVKVIFGI